MAQSRLGKRSTRALWAEGLEDRRLMAIFSGTSGAEIASISSSKSVKAASSSSTKTLLSGTLAPTDASGTAGGVAKFKTETERGVVSKEFEVEIRRLPADTTFTVSIDGVSAGTIRTNAFGQGKLELSTKLGNFPNGLTAVAGSKVTLQNAAGATVLSTNLALVTKINGGGGRGGGGGGADDARTAVKLKARLADSTSNLRGEAEYESETERGLVVSKFVVSVQGGRAGTTVDVTVDGVKVGTITINSLGRGRLAFSSHPVAGSSVAFPANFPTIDNGDAVIVGSATGMLRPRV